MRYVEISEPGFNFIMSEIDAAHAHLDTGGIPRKAEGESLSLSQRVALLVGTCTDLRNTIFIQTRRSSDAAGE